VRPPAKYAHAQSHEAHHQTVARIRGPQAPRVWVCPVCGEKVAVVNLIFQETFSAPERIL
jgi:hypothetical protein